MRKIKITFILLLLTSINMMSQPLNFSLEESQAYALKHNLSILNALDGIEQAKQKVWETTAIGLPQVNASASYNYFIETSTSLVPANLFNPIAPRNTFSSFSFQAPHNASAGLDVSQLIFSGSYIVGLQASKAYKQLSEDAYTKTTVEINALVKDAYVLVLTAEENKTILDSTLHNLQKTLDETRALFRQGFIEETDVTQIHLLLNKLLNTYENVVSQTDLAYNLLKFHMGLSLDQEIILTESLDNIMLSFDNEALSNLQLTYHNHIDYQIQKNKETIAGLNLKLEKSAALPTLAAFYNYQQNGMSYNSDIFGNIDMYQGQDAFDNPIITQGNKWFPLSLVGIQMDIPIFSSGSRISKINQAKIAQEQQIRNTQLLKQELDLRVKTARSRYILAYKSNTNKKETMNLAENIYNKTNIKFNNGMASSLELTQAYNQYLSAEGDYIQSIMTLFSSKTALEKELK